MTANRRARDAHPVAVVGLSCRFPGAAANAEGFWNLLSKGESAHSTVPKDRFNVDAFHHSPIAGLNKSVTNSGHFVKGNVKAWDASFFGVTPEEAEAMDPQQRIMMEVAYEAFENAGIPLADLKGSLTGCWMGVNSNDWRETLFRDPEAAPMHTWTGTGPEYISGRISWFFDMHGPSTTVNSACSSSLVALHQANQSIQSGECELAIVGGANLILNPEYYLFYSNQRFLSPDGKCKSFDANGDGFGRGEGFGAVVLKRMSSAVADGNAIRAVVRGTGVGQDGWTSGITLPNSEAQADLIRRTYARAGLPMDQTDYVEAHGTGTKTGDPAELDAIRETIRAGNRKVLIGSVKMNIGHLEAAAGIAGVIKSILMLENGQITPAIGIDQLNARFDWEESHLEVVQRLTPWPKETGPRRISINSFGASGTIAHAILDGYTEGVTPTTNGLTGSGPKLLIVSANDPTALERQKAAMRQYLSTSSSVPGDHFQRLVMTLSSRRSLLPYRACFISSDLDSFRRVLDSDVSIEHRASVSSPSIAFIFTGQGAQWAGMGVGLIQYRVFRESIERADIFLRSLLGCTWSAKEELLRPANQSRLNSAELSQPLCTILQVALVDLLGSWGITPCAMVGHSSGEIGAAYCLGALTEENAWTAAYWRGNVGTRSALPRGAMLAAGVSKEEAMAFIKRLNSGMAVVACVNSPSNVTISGDESAITDLMQILTAAGHFARRLKVDTAYHSPHLSVIANEYLMRLRQLRPRKAHAGRTMYSSVTGKEAGAEDLGAGNWVRNLISPVLFASAVESMALSKQVDVLVEIGPHSALTAPVTTTLSACGINLPYLSVLTRGEDAVQTAMSAAAKLLARGVSVNISQVNGVGDDKKHKPLIGLPAYQWNHEMSYCAQSRWDREYRMRKMPPLRFLGAPMPQLVAEEHMWRLFLRPSEEHWTMDHSIQGDTVYPAVGYICMAIESARQLAAEGRQVRAFRLRDVRFLSPAMINKDDFTEMTIVVRPAHDGDGEWYDFSISACWDTQTVKRTCTGLFAIDYSRNNLSPAAQEDESIERAICRRLQDAQSSCLTLCDPDILYRELTRIGLGFGPAFRNVVRISKRQDTSYCLVNVVNPASERDMPCAANTRPFIIHPCTFDSITQTIMAATGVEYCTPTPIPISIDNVTIAAGIPYQHNTQLAVVTDVTSRGRNDLRSEIHVLHSLSSRPVLSMNGFRVAQIPSQSCAAGGSLHYMCSKVLTVPSIELLDAEQIPAILDTLADQNSTTHQLNGVALLTAKLAEFVNLFRKFNPELAVLEIIHTDSPAILNSEKDSANSIVHYIQGEWRQRERDIASRYQPPKPIGPTHDIVIMPLQVAEDPLVDINTLTCKVAGLLKPNGFTVAIGPAAKLKAAFVAANLHLHATLPSEDGQDNVLLIAGPDRTWTSQFSGSEIVILEPETVSEAAEAIAVKLKTQLESLKWGATRVKWPAIAYGPPSKRSRCISLLELEEPFITELGEEAFSDVQRFFTVVPDILWVTAKDDPAMYAIDGVSRSIRNEDARISIRTMHFPHADGSIVDLIIQATARDTVDQEFTIKDGTARVVRIAADPVLSDRVTGRELSIMEQVPLSKSGVPRGLEIGELGQLDTLHLIERNRGLTALGDDEVLLRVAYSGLNFKDIMIAMGRVPGTMEGAEGSGTILQVGKCVSNFSAGDQVLCLSIGLHSSIAQVKASACRYLPRSLSLAEAASLPVVHCTAYNAFVRIARPEPGQSILIHAAAGGLGQTAIQYAKHFNMEIFATVGSQTKRKLIHDTYGIPENHILYSRDTCFAKALKRLTAGRGVDVVLNSLSGEILRESWRCLAPGGTFIEVGKAVLEDVRPNHEMGATYSVFDIEHILRNNDTLMTSLLDGALDFVARGIVRPSTQQVFPISRVKEAARLMQIGSHAGKLLLSWDDDDIVEVMGDGGASARLNPNATYMLIGGLGGIGRSLARMLVGLGAKHLCFLSRSGANTAAARTLLTELVGQSIDARAYVVDVADLVQLQQTLNQVAADQPPVHGVIQCAMVLHDSTFANLTYQQWTCSLRAKVQGSRNIDHLLPTSRSLDFFILLSSFAGLFGNIGQSNYGAGCAYQDALAHHRRSKGMKAVSLDLGIISDVGVLAEQGMTENLEELAIFGIGEQALHNLVRVAIQDQIVGLGKVPPQVPTGIASRSAALAAGVTPPKYLTDPRFSLLSCDGSLRDDKAADVAPSFCKRLSAAKASDSASQMETVVEEMLVHRIAKCLGVTEDRIDISRSLPSYGINSLVAIEIRNWLFKEAMVDVTIFNLISPLSIRELVVKIVKGFI